MMCFKLAGLSAHHENAPSGHRRRDALQRASTRPGGGAPPARGRVRQEAFQDERGADACRDQQDQQHPRQHPGPGPERKRQQHEAGGKTRRQHERRSPRPPRRVGREASNGSGDADDDQRKERALSPCRRRPMPVAPHLAWMGPERNRPQQLMLPGTNGLGHADNVGRRQYRQVQRPSNDEGARRPSRCSDQERRERFGAAPAPTRKQHPRHRSRRGKDHQRHGEEAERDRRGPGRPERLPLRVAHQRPRAQKRRREHQHHQRVAAGAGGVGQHVRRRGRKRRREHGRRRSVLLAHEPPQRRQEKTERDERRQPKHDSIPTAEVVGDPCQERMKDVVVGVVVTACDPGKRLRQVHLEREFVGSVGPVQAVRGQRRPRQHCRRRHGVRAPGRGDMARSRSGRPFTPRRRPECEQRNGESGRGGCQLPRREDFVDFPHRVESQGHCREDGRRRERGRAGRQRRSPPPEPLPSRRRRLHEAPDQPFSA